MNHAERLRQWLVQQYGIQVPEDWLEACLDWIQGENQGSHLSPEQLKELVYEQWLLADLRDLGSSCLPPGLAQQEKTTLTGTYCLQVDSVMDVSQPYYGQLQKVTGTENENALVTATQPTQPTWETKASRMLMLKMTDGTQDVQGMEYQRLQVLNTSLLPGAKVQVKGPVLCRLGVIMLTAKNLKVLGGEVDALMEQNTQENLLKAGLNVKHELADTQGQNLQQRKIFSQNGPSKKSNTGASREAKRQVNVNRHVDQANPSRSTQGWQPDRSQAQQITQSASRGYSSVTDDMWDDMDASEVEAMEQQWEEDGVDYEALFDDDAQHQGEPSAAVGCNQKQSASAQRGKRITNEIQAQQPRNHSPHISTQENFSNNNRLTLGKTQNELPYPVQKKIKRTVIGGGSESHGSSDSAMLSASDNVRFGDDNDDDVIFVNSQDSGAVMGSSAFDTPVTSRAEKQTSLTHRMIIASQKSAQTGVRTEYGGHRGKHEAPPSSDSSKQQINKPLGINTPPYTYLSLAMRDAPSDRPCVVRVKAFISTLLSRLDYKTGKWSLQAKINDGSSALDVDLGDEFLTALIGFTAKECLEMRARAKTDMSARNRMTQGIKKCQEQLIQLSCIMEVVMDPSLQRPYVQSHLAVTDSDILLLAKRT